MSEQNPLTKYFDLSIRIRELEAEKEELKEQCIDELKKVHGGKLQDEIGTLSVTNTTKWSYSIFARERIEPLKKKQDDITEQIKNIQKEDQNAGTAEEETIETLRLQLKK